MLDTLKGKKSRMSGNCDECGEHCLQCKCEPFLKRYQCPGYGYISYDGDDSENGHIWVREVAMPPKGKDEPCISIITDAAAKRAVLNQDQVAALISLLQHFVETGRLP